MKVNDAKLRKLCTQGLTTSVIAQRFGVTQRAINLAMARIGVAPRRPG